MAQPLFGLRSSQLIAPPLDEAQFAALEGRDLYVSLNGMRPARRKSQVGPFRTLAAGARDDARLVALNAVYVDLDCYAAGLELEAVLKELRALRHRGQLLPWSFLIRSGRGVWLVWLLRDEADPGLPPKATEANRHLCRRINRALAARFEHQGGDVHSSDLARVARVPGSRNSKADGPGRIVRWETQTPLPAYTLAELEAAFLRDRPDEPCGKVRRTGYKARRSGWVDRGTQHQKRAPRGRAFSPGQAEQYAWRRWGLLLRDLFYLAFYRGGFQQGHRHAGVFWTGYLLKRALFPEPGKRREILRICREINHELKLPLTPADVQRQVTRALAWHTAKSVSGTYLASLFDVTEQEATVLCMLKPARISRRDARRAAVRAAYTDWVEAKGTPPTRDDLAREVAVARFAASRATVARDLRALGYTGRIARHCRALRPASRSLPGSSLNFETKSMRNAARRRPR